MVPLCSLCWSGAARVPEPRLVRVTRPDLLRKQVKGVEVWTLTALRMDLPVWPCSETKGPRVMENRRTSSLGLPSLTDEPSNWSPTGHPRWLLLTAESAAKLPLAPPSCRHIGRPGHRPARAIMTARAGDEKRSMAVAAAAPHASLPRAISPFASDSPKPWATSCASMRVDARRPLRHSLGLTRDAGMPPLFGRSSRSTRVRGGHVVAHQERFAAAYGCLVTSLDEKEVVQ